MTFNILEIFFWAAIFVIFYAYAGYGVVLYLMVKAKKLFQRNTWLHKIDAGHEPEVTFVVPSYNEADIIEEKVENCLSFNYPKEKLKVVFITDGSTDETPELVKKYEDKGVKLLHENKRGGKSAAENRAMKYVDTPIVIFSDANTILPADAVKNIVRHYADPKVGAVSGEKRILSKDKDNASGAGEGIYWKYESALKKLDSDLNTIVGAAGELFSFRKELFTELEEDTVLDDFMLSMRIASKGYKVVYDPEAYAMETASASVKEELKRKIRICAGGWQSMSRLTSALNPMKDAMLSFQYISHRVLRWSVVPLLLFLIFPINIYLFVASNELLYQVLFYGQCTFYIMAMMGWYLKNREISSKLLFVPFYFFIMNYAVFMGFFRFISKKQAAAWERAQRSPVT
ncbi:glycosyltransferase family 2 protein [Cytophagaceae bacterium ABcell3]|nr:glycosyltransferase family 2 protein [Cytophagaceae bacterium ABcell3]